MLLKYFSTWCLEVDWAVVKVDALVDEVLTVEDEVWEEVEVGEVDE